LLNLFDSKSYSLFVRVQNHNVMFKHICEKYVYYKLVSNQKKNNQHYTFS